MFYVADPFVKVSDLVYTVSTQYIPEEEEEEEDNNNNNNNNVFTTHRADVMGESAVFIAKEITNLYR